MGSQATVGLEIQFRTRREKHLRETHLFVGGSQSQILRAVYFSKLPLKQSHQNSTPLQPKKASLNHYHRKIAKKIPGNSL